MRPESFISFIREDKSRYKTATECGFVDPDNDFLIGESGGFLFNIDFIFINTELFSAAAKRFEQTGVYTNAVVDSPDFRNFRKSEEFKRRNGVTLSCKVKDGKILPLRITGEHYNFLNYSRMNKLDESSINVNASTGNKGEGFPVFVDAQYWYFKVKEFSKKNGFHLVVGKSRRGGFSYMEGADSANDVNLNPFQTVLHIASDTKYLVRGNAITAMSKKNLDWYESNTPFNRGYISEDLEDLMLGWKPKNSNIKQGYQSRIVSLSFGQGNYGVAVGKDAKKIKVDELNDAPGLNKMLGVTEPTTRTGAFMTGQIIGFGTGGSKAGNWQEFEDWFYNPASFNAMCFENVWDENSRHTMCGFYKPYWWGLQGVLDGTFAMDKHGNSDWETAITISEKERTHSKLVKSQEEYIVYCAMYSNSPSESFSASTENIFTSVELNQWIDVLKHDPKIRFYRDGWLTTEYDRVVFKTNNWLKDNNHIIHQYIEEVPLSRGNDAHGCLRIFYPPMFIGGQIPTNLYRIWYDPVALDKAKDKISYKDSLSSVYVYMRPNNIVGNPGDILVASYCGRTPLVEDTDKFVHLLADYYNAMIMFESDRGTMLQNSKMWKKVHKLAQEPTMAWDKSLAGSISRVYGVSCSSPGRKLAGLGYLKDWLYTKRGIDVNGKQVYTFHYIYDLPTLLELQKWNLKGNFDRTSALIVGQFDIKETLINELKIKDKNIKVESIFKRTWYSKV
jgi:hypothetical protein